MTHTPGPWLIHDAATLHMQDVTVARLGEEGRARSCRVVSHQPGVVADTHADARLIAAAPDLLQACEIILGSYEAALPYDGGDWSTNPSSNPRRILRNAIEKARGTL